MRESLIAENCSNTINSLLKYLGVEISAQTGGLAELIKEYERLTQKTGKTEIGQKLGLNIDEVEKFNQAVREVKRQLGHGTNIEWHRNLTIAQLRLLSWVETIADRKPDFVNEGASETSDAAEIGYKQIRALELIIRSLVTEKYEDQNKLASRITELLGSETLRKWQKSADKGDILSGSLFSELATLFIDKREFASNYQDYYHDTPFLTLLKDKRGTLQNFLDDIRLVRNRLAHHKKITPIQIDLLSLYYEEIVEPIQQAHDNQATQVDPSAFFDVSKEQMDNYFSNLHEDVQGIRSDIKELAEALGSKLGEIGKGTEAIKAATKKIEGKTKWIAIGVAVLILIGGITFYEVTKTKIDLGNVKKETSDDPRKELVNLGYKWEWRELGRAMSNRDDRAVDLFLQGKIAWGARGPADFIFEPKNLSYLKMFKNAGYKLIDCNECYSGNRWRLLTEVAFRTGYTGGSIRNLEAAELMLDEFGDEYASSDDVTTMFVWILGAFEHSKSDSDKQKLAMFVKKFTSHVEISKPLKFSDENNFADYGLYRWLLKKTYIDAAVTPIEQCKDLGCSYIRFGKCAGTKYICPINIPPSWFEILDMLGPKDSDEKDKILKEYKRESANKFVSNFSY